MSTHTAYTATYLTWQHHDTSLRLRADDRRLPVPDLIATLLLDGYGHGLTDDPALDLIRLEQDLRRYACHLANQVQHAADEVAYARDEITLAGVEHGATGRRHLRDAQRQLGCTAAIHTTWVDHHQVARCWIAALRAFVVDAAVPDGLLAQAAAGWQRPPWVPAFVVVYDSERAFLTANPRRGTPAWWGRATIAGIDFGALWRRDGDDDNPDTTPLPRSGPWRLVYLPRTGEACACRRYDHLPVWLLGTGLHDHDATVTLLSELESHMREPNSLIFAAHKIHAEQQRQAIEVASHL